MVNEPINLVLEHLRAIRSDMGDMKDMLHDHGHRLGRLETSIASLRRELAGDAEDVVHLGLRIDRLTLEVDRIKRRLDLTD